MMSYTIPIARLSTGGATHDSTTLSGAYYQIGWNNTTNRIPHIQSSWGVTLSGTNTNRGRLITLQPGASYYLWARPNLGGGTTATIQFAFYDTSSGTQVGTVGRIQTGYVARLATELYDRTAAAVILAADFSGSARTFEVRATVLSGSISTSVVPINNDTDAQGIGSLVVFATRI
jgi:hypothetical protein